MSTPGEPHLALICHLQYTPDNYDRILHSPASAEQQSFVFGLNIAVALVDPNSSLDGLSVSAFLDGAGFYHISPWKWFDWSEAKAQVYELVSGGKNPDIDFGKNPGCPVCHLIGSGPGHQLGRELEADGLAPGRTSWISTSGGA